MVQKKVVSRKNLQWVDSKISKNTVTLEFKKRNIIGKLFGSKVIKKINIPQNMVVKSIENNKPKVGQITIFFK